MKMQRLHQKGLLVLLFATVVLVSGVQGMSYGQTSPPPINPVNPRNP